MRFGGALVALVLAATGCSAPTAQTSPTPSQTPTATPSPSVTPLSTGDCLGSLSPGSAVGDIEVVNCATGHHWEVFSVVPVNTETLPTAAELATLAEAKCLPGFADYVGVAPRYSRYDAIYLTPDEAAWQEPTTRVITCLAGKADKELTGSAKGDSALFPKSGECTGPQDVAILDVKTVSCSKKHNYEVYAEKELPKKTPTKSELAKLVKQVCEAGFTSFIGISPAKSRYQYTYFAPDLENYSAIKDRRLVCSVGSATKQVTGSLKGVKK